MGIKAVFILASFFCVYFVFPPVALSQQSPNTSSWELSVLGFSMRDATGIPFGDFNKGDRGIAYAVHVSKSLAPSLDLGLYGAFSIRSQTQLSFDDISDIDLLLRYFLLSQERKGGFRRVNPYALGGTSLNFLKNGGTGLNVSTPFGLGLLFRLSESIGLDVNFAYKNDVSGFRDYVALQVGSVVSLGKAPEKKGDTDKDGIIDELDACPHVAGLPDMQGCPDSDGDLVGDALDPCPYEAGMLGGCPDDDVDGIPNKDDKCPTIAGLEAMAGCPDKDGDGFADGEDACPSAAGLTQFGGCPDTDADGIADPEDKCPFSPGVMEENGCPISDTDQDGITDAEDLCPNEKGSTNLGGCPDSDADGIIDRKDNCPQTPGTLLRDGCPEIAEEITQTLEDARYGVQFAQNYAHLLKSSYAILDKLSAIMHAKPQYKLIIAGHTDSYGDAQKNLRLSEARAERCHAYLVEKGIDPNRIVYTGYGESSPLVPNNSPQNRARNRRVEFRLFTE